MIWIWILIAVAVLALITFLFAMLCMHAAFGVRCEGNPNLKYFTHEDFDDLEAEPISFKSDKGQTINGFVYTCYDIEPKAIVICAHGMGGGHLSYTTEIHTIAKAGYAVLAYDNTGTMASEGKSLGSFYQSVKDIRSALKFVRETEELNKFKVVLAGHSWGAYTVCQALSFAEEQVSGVVAFSPPDSSVKVICDNMKQMMKIPTGWLRPAMWLSSIIRGGISSAHTCSSVLLKTKSVPVMILQGDNDKAVTLKNSPISYIDILEKENITSILYEGKEHNVYQSKRSEKYLNDTFAEIKKVQKQYGKAGLPEEEKSRLYDIDYNLITEEDPEVMQTVLDFIEKCVKRA